MTAKRAWVFAALLVAAGVVSGGVSHAQASSTPLVPNIAQLEQQASQLSDIEAVKRLQRAYGYYLDRSDWDNIVDLLTDDATMEYGPAGVFVGKAQEKTAVFRTEKRHSPNGRSYPWIVRSSALVNHYYIYAVDRDFGPFFLKFSSYFPYTAKLCLNGHEYAKQQLAGIRGFQLAVSGPTFNEFALRIRGSAAAAAERLREKGILAGVPLDQPGLAFPAVPDADRTLLIAVTERHRRADKRDGGDRITLSSLDPPDPRQSIDLLALDQALHELETVDARKARVIELRAFGGLDFAEIAEVLDITRATLARDFRTARAWLYRALDLPPADPAQ